MPLLGNLQLLGMVGVASYALARFAVRFQLLSWHRAYVVAIPRARMPQLPRGFTVRPVGADELQRSTIDITPEQQSQRFAQGIECLGAFNASGALTGVVWLTAKPCFEGDVALMLHPPANGAWDTGMWIHPDHRMGRSFQALWAGVAAWLEARGLDWSYSGIADYNLRSQGAHRRLGMEIVGKISALRVGRWQLIAAGEQGWRLVRAPRRLDWRVPPVVADADTPQLTPSLPA